MVYISYRVIYSIFLIYQLHGYLYSMYDVQTTGLSILSISYMQRYVLHLSVPGLLVLIIKCKQNGRVLEKLFE